jgi:hypothetical protein
MEATGGGQSRRQHGNPKSQWIHLEVFPSGWHDDQPVEQMLKGGKVGNVVLGTIDGQGGEDDMAANILVQERVKATGQLANAVWEYMPHTGRKRCVTLTGTMMRDTVALFTDRGWPVDVKVVDTGDMPVYGRVDGPVPQRADGDAYDGWGCFKS